MINALWLLLIVPASTFAGFIIAAFCHASRLG